MPSIIDKVLNMSELECAAKMKENNEWLQEKYEKLQEKYANKFIAIDNKEVVAIGNRPEELINRLKERNIGIESLLIEFIPEKGLILIV